MTLSCLAAAPAAADTGGSSSFWFAGRSLIFESSQLIRGDVAVSTGDAAFLAFLAAAGATLSYQPGQKYVIVTAADRRTITFTLEDVRFLQGSVAQDAPFAPYAAGTDAYVPFLALAKALYIDPVMDGSTTVLQPQLASLDVRTQDRTTIVTLRGGKQLRYKRLSGPDDEHVSLLFAGTATTLEAERRLPWGSALRGVSIHVSGSVRNPSTTVDFDVAPGTGHALQQSDSVNAISIAFAPINMPLPGEPIPASGAPVMKTAPLTDVPDMMSPAPAFSPSLAAAPQAVAPAQVTGVTTNPEAPRGSARIEISMAGSAGFTWHRLPDNRWYVDLKPATLTVPAQDVALPYESLTAMRVKSFAGPTDGLPTVRIALSLGAQRDVSVAQTRAVSPFASER